VARHAPVSTLGASFREMVALIDGSALVVSPNTAGCTSPWRSTGR
jgi:hypothetical protein